MAVLQVGMVLACIRSLFGLLGYSACPVLRHFSPRFRLTVLFVDTVGLDFFLLVRGRRGTWACGGRRRKLITINDVEK